MSKKLPPPSKEETIADVDLDALLDGLDLDEPVIEASGSTDDELGDLLDDLGIESEVSIETAELADDELDELLAEVETPVDNSELYAEDEIDESIEAAPDTDKSDVEDNKKKAKKDKLSSDEKKASKKTETKPKVKVDSTVPTSEILKARLGEDGKRYLELEEGVHLDMAIVDALPKKVKEKLLNLYAHIENGTVLSTYIDTALTLLNEEEKTMAEITEHYMTKWSKGTSSSQVGQIVRLFRELKICNFEGKTMSLNKKSKLLPLLIKLK